MKFLQRKRGLQRAPPEETPKVKDERPAPGISATRSNVGPDRRSALDDEDMHIYEGTSSGMGMHKTPRAGSREGQLR